MAAVIERIDSRKLTVQDFVRSVSAEFRKLYNSQRQDEMSDFRDEARRQLREMNKKWGEISSKLGTLVEDLATLSRPRIISAYDLMVWLKRRLPAGRMKEFDALVVIPDCVCLNSTKANPA